MSSSNSSSAVTADEQRSYWAERREYMYYKYVTILVRVFARDARSLIDVGSSNTEIIEAFDWIPVRHALDLKEPYRSNNVQGITADFLTFVPEQRYDFATCLQVLEHIPDATKFARRLFDVAENVLISVPFMWPEGTPTHVHDPVSMEKLVTWTGKKPDHYLIVPEPFSGRGSSRRLIAYFHSPQSEFSLKSARKFYREKIG